MRAYSEDLRVRVLAAVDGGLPRAEAARRFGVSLPTIKRYLKLRRETGGLAPRPRPGQPSRQAAALRAGLLPQLEAHPDATLAEHCARWEAATGERVSPATVSRVIARQFGWTRKKVAERLRAGRGRAAGLARADRGRRSGQVRLHRRDRQSSRAGAPVR